ncbi:MAG: HIT family protein [Pseudomonadaceae bacterium]|nr:HIT family protein [Pseudomonadaceae bacterium]
MSYDDNNVFAKILRSEMPAFVVEETDETLAFMDVMPQSDGHTLVIPKYPAQDIFELPESFAREVISATQRVAGAVRKAFDPAGVMIAQLNGEAAGQTVFHLHFHIIPRYEKSDMKLHAREMADMALLEQHAQRIRDAFAG